MLANLCRYVFLIGFVAAIVLDPAPALSQVTFRDMLPLPQDRSEASPAAAAPPMRLRDRLVAPFRRVSHEAEEKGMELEITHGPWLIMCASFIGEGKHQAEALCRELRSLGLDAYLYHHSFDYSDELQGLGFSRKKGDGIHMEFGMEPARMRAANPEKFEDFSVLVGHFSSDDDSRALKTLAKIKRMFPKSLHVSENSRSFQRMSGYREWVRWTTKDEEIKNMGPMRAAFLVPNPLLPEDYFERHVVDPIVIKMNRGDKHSLLNNPKNYTVKVATFRGESTFNREEIEERQREFDFLRRTGRGLTESRLMEAEANANFLVDLLRRQGWEAYSYHDRDSSIVCVGSFDWVVKNPDSPDKMVNPEAQRIINHFQARVVDNIPGLAPYYETKTEVGPTGKKIAYDLIPVSVNVPRIR